MILDIDWGNTALKWCLSGASVQKDRLAGRAVSLEALVTHIKALPIQPSAVRMALVASRQDRAAQYKQLIENSFACQLHLASTLEHARGLTTNYLEPQRLGVDRWLAMLAGWHRFEQAFVLFDAGTALTVDLVNAEGQHLGGSIAPGLGSLADMLSVKTGLPAAASSAIQSYGITTEQCIQAGVYGMFDAFVQAQYSQAVELLGEAVKVLVTGGDARRVVMTVVPDWQCQDLVLSGLKLAIPLGGDL